MAKMIRAGIYNKVIIIQRAKTLNKNGFKKTEWEDVAQVRASIEPIQGREYFSGPFQMGEIITRVRIRYRPDINRKMRVIYGDRVLEIYSVIDSKERHEELQLMCKEGEAYNG